MPQAIPPIIPDIRGRAWSLQLGAAALVLGSAAAWWYARAGLTLSHYDAKAHLVVARRIADSLTPGWVQIGAVWLPLPHLVSAIPVQWDFFCRTGAFGVALSILSFAVSVGVLGRLLTGITRSRIAALAGALVVALNPSVLYLQTTPMTETLLMAFTLLAAWFGTEAFRSGEAAANRRAGLALAAAVLTRYDAWPFTGLFLALGVLSALRQGRAARETLVVAGRLAAYPTGAVLAFLAMSRATVGEWAVDGTLRRRFRSPDMEGRLRMKTGSLQEVSALAGYVNAASGKTYVAVIILNHPGAQLGAGEAIQAALVNWVFGQ